jgi:hypothetical protein
MLLSLLLGASAGASYVITTYPCQRLGWAWRNVWVTCSIDSRVPGTLAIPKTGDTSIEASSPNFNEGFNYRGGLAYDAPSLDLEVVGTAPTLYSISQTAGTLLGNTGKWSAFCTRIGHPGSSQLGVRTACRRAIDLYGSLLELCRNPVRAKITLPANGVAGAPVAGRLDIGTKNSWHYAIPHAGIAPHHTNAVTLNWLQTQCIAPNTVPLVPYNSCPGLVGWFTVTYQACNFNNVVANAAAWQKGNTPQYTADAVPTTVAANFEKLTNPNYLCTTGAVGANSWNPSGPAFRSSACRRALDQFTRTATRCNAVNSPSMADWFVPNHKALTKLGIDLAVVSPNCN